MTPAVHRHVYSLSHVLGQAPEIVTAPVAFVGPVAEATADHSAQAAAALGSEAAALAVG